MALIKQHTLPNTVVVNYWRLAPTFEVNVENNVVTGQILGYTSAQDREDGATKACWKDYIIEVDNINANIREQVYEKLPTTKLKPLSSDVFFDGATSDE